MGTSEHREVERKYEIDSSTVLPELVGVDGVARASQQKTHELEATYFDTADLDLLRHRVTLRRRTGGHDAGWHLKLPEGESTRREVRMPLDAGTDAPPDTLLDPVRAFVRDRALQPVARLATHRLEQTLLDDQDVELAEVSDDTVTAERVGSDEGPQIWREVEVELVDGSPELLDRIDAALTAAGCTPASVGSKLARALGETAYDPNGSTDAQKPTGKKGRKAAARGPARELLRTYLAEQVQTLHEHDRGVRAGEPESVHRMRIAARRMRSALVTYRPLLVREAVEPLREELRWLGQALSQARDAKVLRSHLDGVVDGQPAELVLGPVTSRIDASLATEHQAGLEAGTTALRSERYYRLLDRLDAILESLPVAEDADRKAKKVIPRLLRRDAKRLERAVEAVDEADDPGTRDAALHEARKKSKRFRYAAESAVPAFGKPAKKLAKKTKRVQDALGQHQDSVFARRSLREYAVQAHLAGENGFTCGRLHALEEARAEQAQADFEREWEQVPRSGFRRLLKG